MTWYNEIDPYVAAWLRELQGAGQIQKGTVDERRIETLQAQDIPKGRAHFFAGIGGWDYALRLAGWPDDRPVWTGSCPCQPFSVAGKQSGGDDPRHLWPAWFRLIRECRPDTIFGEQVSGAIGHGWLDGVFTDLEAEGYACGAVVLGAHSVGAPHIRQRIFWVADATGKRWHGGNVVQDIDRGEITWPGASERCADRDMPEIRLEGGQLRFEWSAQPKPIEMVNGLSDWASCLRAYGNSIVPQVAAVIIRTYLEEPEQLTMSGD